MGEDAKELTIRYAGNLRSLFPYLAVLGLGGLVGGVGFDQLNGGQAQSAMAESQQTVDPVFKRDVERDFKDVDDRLNRIDGKLKSQDQDLDNIQSTLRQIVCHFDPSADGCLRMPKGTAR